MSRESFAAQIATLTQTLVGRPLDARLAAALNAAHGPGSATFEALRASCEQGMQEGWMGEREAAGIRYGRVLKATPATHGFSVDVVAMQDVVGPHHRHPNGEIDLVMPQGDSDARFDGQPAGWMVYGPGSAHRPTVTGGRALVLYLLPEGAIDFTRPDAARPDDGPRAETPTPEGPAR